MGNMKKVYCVLIIIVVLAVGISVFFMTRDTSSPEKTLHQISNDVKELGIDGLMPYLTEETKEKVSKITNVTDNKLVSTVLTLLDRTEFVGVLKSNLKEVEWKLGNIEKNKSSADVTLEFNYIDLVQGTINIKMLKENGEWKISGIDMPKF